jgi:hypothetical protein
MKKHKQTPYTILQNVLWEILWDQLHPQLSESFRHKLNDRMDIDQLSSLVDNFYESDSGIFTVPHNATCYAYSVTYKIT